MALPFCPCYGVFSTERGLGFTGENKQRKPSSFGGAPCADTPLPSSSEPSSSALSLECRRRRVACRGQGIGPSCNLYLTAFKLGAAADGR